MSNARRRVARWAAVPAAAVVAACALPAASWAEQEPVPVAQHGAHSVWVSPSEPYDVVDKTTYWDLVSLDGICGFTNPTLELSDMRETFFIQDVRSGASTGIGKILDERFELTEYAADGTVARVYRGTGDEYAQFRNAATGAIESVNLNVVFRGASDDGRHLDFSLTLRVRTDARTGEFTRFDAHVRSCHVR